MPSLQILQKRANFLAAARGRRQPMPGFLLQGIKRGEMDDNAPRIGFTCSKKIGNAVTRNRAKRRLRAIAREIMPATAQNGWDYVLVGRPGATISMDYAELHSQLGQAMRKLHTKRSTT